MPLIDTPDGGYTHAVTTAGEGDGNDVVYDNWVVPGQKTPVWDKFSYEDHLSRAGIVRTPPNVVQPRPPLPPSPPITPSAFNWNLLQLTQPGDERVPDREYSYWPHTVRIGDYVYAFCCSSSGHPPFFRIDANGEIFRMGPMIGYASEGEGWYWDKRGLVYLIDGPRLRRVNPFNGEDEILFDISGRYPNHNLWQAHSSDDGQVHSATVRQNSDGFNPHIATVICNRGALQFVPVFGQQDEAHMLGSGSHCIIEEDNNNRIVEVASGREQLILDADGALSHIDCGPDYMVGEDNINGVAWKIEIPSLHRTELERTWGMGHVSVQNGKCLLSNAGSLLWMDLNGGGLTHILDHGMVVPGDANDPYDFQVKANLDATGTVALFMTNEGNPIAPRVVKIVHLT
jgi:hypothetical protein